MKIEHYLSCFLIVVLFNSSTNRLSDFTKYSIPLPGGSEIIKMVPVSGGSFLMGDSDYIEQSPLHDVTVSDFWMGAYEITWQQYELFVYRNKGAEKKISEERNKQLGIDGVSSATRPYTDMSYGMGKDGYPAVNMTHYAAISYCKWLSSITGEFYRLPTEAEWEFAARGGSKSNYFFDVSGTLDEYAWYSDNSGSKYQPVGQKKPNNLGLYDILGNASEWSMDQYEVPYNAQTKNNPWVVPNKLYPRVIRGGSWKDEKAKITVTWREGSQPEWKIRDPQLPKSRWWLTNAPFVGFRIVRPRTTPSTEEIKKYWLKVIEDYN